MPHCTLDEAWGYTNKKTEEPKIVEPFSHQTQNEGAPIGLKRKHRRKYKNVEDLNSDFSEMDLDSENDPCDDFMIHFKKCSSCRRKLRRFFKKLKKQPEPEHKQIPDQFYYIIIGMFIILVLDALIRLSKAFK